MTDNELLLAISNMIDPIREDVQGIKKEVKELKREVEGVKKEVEEVKTRVKNIELTQETQILPRLNTIEACYTSTYDRYKDSVDDYETMKQDISIIKKVVAEHSEKLQRIG